MTFIAPLTGLFLSALYCAYWWYIRKHWQRTTGTVTRHERPDSEEVGPGTPVLLYADKEGKIHTVHSTWGGVGGLLKGESVPVYYSKDNPERAQVGGFMNEYGIPVLIVLFSFVIALFGQ